MNPASEMHQERTLYPDNERVFLSAGEDLRLRIRRDGCLDIHRSFNGYTVHEADAEKDYLHICDLKEFIERLQFVYDQTKEFVWE